MRCKFCGETYYDFNSLKHQLGKHCGKKECQAKYRKFFFKKWKKSHKLNTKNSNKIYYLKKIEREPDYNRNTYLKKKQKTLQNENFT